MSENTQVINNRSTNASASAFGWDFQRNAAIFLMLKNIKKAKSIKVEGTIEDIEIELDNGNIIYSQAKSIENINSTSNINQKLKDALTTLNNAGSKNNVENLIYITNIPNPFHNKSFNYFMNGFSNLLYSDLPIKCQEKINKIISDNNYSIDTNKLGFVILPFIGENLDNRYKYIKDEISDFLCNCGLENRVVSKNILTIWQNDYFENATISNQNIKIKKENMIWTIIVDLCSFDNNRSSNILDDCDEAMQREIKRNYESIINNKSEDFEFFNKVLNDYSNFEKNLSEKNRMSKFVNEQYVLYEKYFEIDNIDSNIKNCLIKLIIKNILDIRYITDNIKKGAGL